MTYRIVHSFADGMLKVALSGPLQPADLGPLLREVAGLVRDHAASRLMVDVRELKHDISPIDTLRLVETYAGEENGHRTAVLESPGQAARHHFHETAAINRGHKLLHFTDEAKAAAWLQG